VPPAARRWAAGRMPVDLLSLILLALAAALYPLLLAGVIMILGRPRPLRMLVAFLIGGLTLSLSAGFGIVRVLEQSGVVDKSNPNTHPGIDIVIGAVSLLVAWVAWAGGSRDEPLRVLRRPRPAAPKKTRPAFTERMLGGNSVIAAALAGVMLNLPGIWYLDALAGIARAEPSTAVAILEILLFNVIMFLLVEVPIVGYVVNPAATAALVTNLQAWGRSHARGLMIVVATAVGTWLVIKGVVNLVS